MKASDWKYKSIIFNINVFLTVIHRGIINFHIILIICFTSHYELVKITKNSGLFNFGYNFFIIHSTDCW